MSAGTRIVVSLVLAPLGCGGPTATSASPTEPSVTPAPDPTTSAQTPAPTASALPAASKTPEPAPTPTLRVEVRVFRDNPGGNGTYPVRVAPDPVPLVTPCFTDRTEKRIDVLLEPGENSSRARNAISTADAKTTDCVVAALRGVHAVDRADVRLGLALARVTTRLE